MVLRLIVITVGYVILGIALCKNGDNAGDESCDPKECSTCPFPCEYRNKHTKN